MTCVGDGFRESERESHGGHQTQIRQKGNIGTFQIHGNLPSEVITWAVQISNYWLVWLLIVIMLSLYKYSTTLGSSYFTQ